jgi:outer membrane protein assembly factor BamE
MHFMSKTACGRGVFYTALALATALGGCKQAPELPAVLSPYRIDIQQGNVVTQEMIAKLKAGMTRSQVRFVLGSPLVVDPFRSDRWDYVSMYQKQGKDVERRRVTVIFDDDKLVRIEGDVALSEGAAAPAKPADQPPPKPAPSAENLKPGPAAAKSEPLKPPAPAAKPAAISETKAGSDVPAAEAVKPGTPLASDEKKGEAAGKDAPKDKPKQPGFFGRMLDKLGI